MTAVVLATAGYDHKIRFWEASSRVCTRTVRYPDSQVNCLAISDDKLFLAAGAATASACSTSPTRKTSAPVAEFSHAGNATACGFLQRHISALNQLGGTVKTFVLRAPPHCKTTFACTDGSGDIAIATATACLRRAATLVSATIADGCASCACRSISCRETLRWPYVL